jgi:predicted membrane chloride channel (bestrophin family)
MTYLSVYHFHVRRFDKIIGSDAKIRAFMEMMSLFIGLLLTFYTSLRLARWWSQRTQGVEAILQACDKLTLLLTQGVTRNEEVLDAIRRYADASLLLYFLDEFSKEEKLDVLEYFEFLTKDEKEKLPSVPDTNLWAQAIWVWSQHLIDKCHEAGLTAGPPHYVQLTMACEGGRRGAARIGVFDMAPMPMAYVHLLGMMVKLYGLLLAFLMALLGVKHAEDNDWIAFGRTCFRAGFMPFLYNSIMLMGDLLAHPFGSDVTSFANVAMRNQLWRDYTAITKVGQELPGWIAKLKDEKVRKDSPTAIP